MNSSQAVATGGKSIDHLPNELIVMVGRFARFARLRELIYVSRRFRDLLTPELFRAAGKQKDWHPFYPGARMNNVWLMEQALSYGCPVDRLRSNSWANTALYVNVLDTEPITHLLSGTSALFITIEYDNVDAVEFLIARGAKTQSTGSSQAAISFANSTQSTDDEDLTGIVMSSQYDPDTLLGRLLRPPCHLVSYTCRADSFRLWTSPNAPRMRILHALLNAGTSQAARDDLLRKVARDCQALAVPVMMLLVQYGASLNVLCNCARHDGHNAPLVLFRDATCNHLSWIPESFLNVQLCPLGDLRGLLEKHIQPVP